MNTTVDSAMVLAEDVVDDLDAIEGVEIVLCPPFVGLVLVEDVINGTSVGLGAQNMYWEAQGAFTGEISPLMLQALCKYVILGHSERRTLFGETDEDVSRKVGAALEYNIRPIVCVGENQQQHDARQTAAVLDRQVRAVFTGMSPADAATCVLAYEPIWAIGTGRAAHGPDAQESIGGIRALLSELVGTEAAFEMRLLYGGSVTGANAAEFFSQPDIDGALVGGASLKPADFVRICAVAQQVRRQF